nr:hypothetical protein [Egicoccus sp.]
MPARRWTDEQLRDAIATCTTWRAVNVALGLSGNGGVSDAVRRRCDELGLDCSHIGTAAARRRWTDDELAAAVATCTNLKQVFDRLGLTIGGGAWLAMQDHIRRLGLCTDHWARPIPAERTRRRTFSWPEATVREACEGARSVRAVMAALGLDPDRKLGRSAVERHMRSIGVEPRDLEGQGWSRGRSVPRRRGRPLEELLVLGRPALNTHSLKRRLVREGYLVYACAICGLSEWRAAPISLHLDHVNGDRCDNRRDNLRLLCPNCHSQTDTFAGRNMGAR